MADHYLSVVGRLGGSEIAARRAAGAAAGGRTSVTDARYRYRAGSAAGAHSIAALQCINHNLAQSIHLTSHSWNRVYSGDKSLYDALQTNITVPCGAAGAWLAGPA